MTKAKRADDVLDYKLVFDLLDDGIATLEGDPTMDFRDSVRVSEEIEALREITEQVKAQSAGVQSLTVGSA